MSILDRALTLFTDVRAGEAPTALLLMLNVFLLLAAYYILKPVREALILSEPRGAEAKSYLAAAMAIVLVILIPAYSKLVNRIIRSRLITFVTLIFVACLVGFWGLDKAGARHLGYPFFVWVGIFNVMVVAQFWGFANDVYRSEAGKRLFPIVAFGGNLGAMAGPLISKGLEKSVDLFQLLLVAAGILVACIGLTWIVSNRAIRWHRRRRLPHEEARARPACSTASICCSSIATSGSSRCLSCC
jgi:AAA family ATP:ADP antiporter